MIGWKKTGDWDKAQNIMDHMAHHIERDVKDTLEYLGFRYAKETKLGVLAGAPGGQRFLPLDDATIARKGSSKPLLDTRELVNSITHTVQMTQQTVYVGLLRQARHSSGIRLANLGMIHERGLGHVPARPFLRPTMESKVIWRKARRDTLRKLKQNMRRWADG